MLRAYKILLCVWILLFCAVSPHLAAAQAYLSSPDIRTGGSDLHPDIVYASYFGSTPVQNTMRERLRTALQPLLEMFLNRNVRDDNFTLRVYDTSEELTLLEVFTLQREQEAYEETGTADWLAIDAIRRKHTRRLSDKYVQLGIPKGSVAIRWGRRNQVYEAREREASIVHYELRLARLLDFSLLATEVGTVETFNTDKMESSSGARGRYQMLPYSLSESRIHQYHLATTYGNRISVKEEHHPLFTMEPAFAWMRGSSNAVGHEIPGLSAYHAGPGTIIRLYSIFLQRAEEDAYGPETTVLDAYVWALTEGYDLVSGKTRFGSSSRGYVLACYASLRAVEDVPIDTTQTLTVEQLQLARGMSITLRELLVSLEESYLHWPRDMSSLSLYERFRHLNPHINLPPATTQQGVPERGNIRLQALAQGKPLRFFLPLRTTAVLKSRGLNIIDEAASFQFDENTYTTNIEDETTEWDRVYQEFVRNTAHFGFTLERRERLREIVNAFENLSERKSSRFRELQLAIIQHHWRLWNYKGWEELAALVSTRLSK